MFDFHNGDLEAAGAIAGMRDTYGSPPTGMTVGQRCTWHTTKGDDINGIVIARNENTLIIAEHVPGQGRRIHQANADEVAAF